MEVRIMKNTQRMVTVCTVMLLLSFLTDTANAQNTMSRSEETSFAAEQQLVDRPATHNMLVVGEKTVYLSHLPMFQEVDGQGQSATPMPHRYQAILEVTFTRQGSAPQQEYVQDRRNHRTTTIYTLNPETFVLPMLVSSEAQREPLRSFTANTIFRGHLERDDSIPILRDVEVRVKQVVHFREFEPGAEKPTQLEYLCFGKGQELFLAHVITAPPDFDQILSITITDHQFTDEELAKGVSLVFPGTTNSAAERLHAPQQVMGEIKTCNPPVPRKIHIEVERELYFEEGELRMPPDFQSTPEEERAGFP
jgi:hypothetical protein